MNDRFLLRTKTATIPRRAAIAFLAAATVALPLAPSAAPQASTIVALAKIREAWVADLRSKKLEPILKFYAADAVFLQPSASYCWAPTATPTSPVTARWAPGLTRGGATASRPVE